MSEFSPIIIIPPMFPSHLFTYDLRYITSAINSVVK